MSRFVLTSAVLVGALLACAGEAAADYKRTFTPEIQFLRQNKPGDAGNCGVISVAPFPAIAGATSATATFTVATSGAPRTETRTATAPAFNDTVKYVGTFVAPAGTHWVHLGGSAVDGPGADDCTVAEQRARAAVSKTATVVVTISGGSPDCTAATKASKAARATVAARRKALAKARGKAAKRRAAKRLATAKKKAATAKRKQDQACRP